MYPGRNFPPRKQNRRENVNESIRVREVRAVDAASGVSSVGSSDSNSIDVYADRGGSLISEIANLASAASVELCDVHISEPSLENLFLHHTGRSMRE